MSADITSIEKRNSPKMEGWEKLNLYPRPFPDIAEKRVSKNSCPDPKKTEVASLFISRIRLQRLRL